MSNQMQAVMDRATRTNGVMDRTTRANGHTASTPAPQRPPADPCGLDTLVRGIARYWWVELVAGVLWTVIAFVVLKFDHASVVTVGILTGVMFLLFSAEQFALAYLDRNMRGVWTLFGILMGVAGIVSLAHPVATFAGLADILGFVFLVLGAQWMVQAFAERAFNSLWWLSLTSGILMVGMGFWVSGQFFLGRAYTLLVFAGIWAATKGVTDIIRAFQIRSLGS